MHNRHWENCLSLIRKEISDQQYQTWFKPIILLKITSSTITLQVPTKFFYEWLEDHYLKLLNNTVKKVLGKKTKIEYVVSEVKEEAKSVNTKRKIKIEEIKQTKFDNLNRNFKFKTFISGKCNSVARAAGKRICKNPGDNPFNPLMVYGGVGLGKTHLIQSIGNKISKKNQKSVYYVTSEKFANQFIDALKENRLKDFTKFYVNIDCLIIDDVQFFKGKEKTQEVFFHIFNQLNLNNKQIILSADKSPINMDGLEQRLISRFKSGLTVELEKPEFETRLNILNAKINNENIKISEEVIHYIAVQVDTNIRELEGVLISLLAHSTITKKPIDIELTKSIIGKIVKDTNKEINISYIQEIVSKFFNISINEMKDKARKKEIVIARQVAMYFSKDFTNNSLKSIGFHFGGRDHSTVIHAVQSVNDMIDTDSIFKKNVEEIKKRISV
ncbi:MAG: chromosomal replication initiator protein DnaA [Flammeovirgaceae bacterium]|jgi:chromosomal replication initiator protein|nr:chromosomal replication initiator protein DnaA [Flammeovirgaceae bacterium]|tara:strand:- start:743 stop:2071 length:1329 start_codon:yes stop_codon:yes gene_type:complete